MDKISIFLGGIRTKNWHELYKSVFKATTHEFELIFVGPYPPGRKVSKIPNVRFIQDFGSSSRCYQIGLLESKYDFVTWAADDGYFLDNQCIDKAFSILHSMGPSHKNVVSFKYFEGGIDTARKSDEFWKMKSHPPLRATYIPGDYYLLMNGLMHKDYLIDIGGWDCSFESHGISTVDLAIRVQNDKGVIKMLDEPFMHVSHFPNDSGDHAPVHFAHIEHDEPYIYKMYSDISSKNRTKIDINNWKNAPDVWHRRFGKKI